jgi:hypothetical protein
MFTAFFFSVSIWFLSKVKQEKVFFQKHEFAFFGFLFFSLFLFFFINFINSSNHQAWVYHFAKWETNKEIVKELNKLDKLDKKIIEELEKIEGENNPKAGKKNCVN